MKQLPRYAKTVVAVLAAVAVVAQSALTDDTVTTDEWVKIALAFVAALGVYAVPNRPPAGEAADPAVSEQGATTVGLVVGAVLLVVGLVLVYQGAWPLGAVVGVVGLILMLTM